MRNQGLAVLIVAVVIIAFYAIPKILGPTSKQYKQSSITQPQFRILSVDGKRKYDMLYVVGEIKNIGTVATGVQVEAIARDKNGRLVASKKFWPNSINNIYPGSSIGIEYHLTKDKSATRVELQIISTRVWD